MREHSKTDRFYHNNLAIERYVYPDKYDQLGITCVLLDL